MGLAYLRWASQDLAYFFVGIAIFFWVILDPLLKNTLADTILWAIVAIVAFYYTFIKTQNWSIKLRMRVILMDVEAQAFRSTQKNEPTEYFISSLDELRSLLLRYATPTRKMLTLDDYEQIQVQKKVDVLFGCINELIFHQSYLPSKMPRDSKYATWQKDFNFELVGDWAAELTDHFVCKRSWFRRSSYGFSTLKYYLDEKLRLFKTQFPSVYKEEKANADAFYDHLDRMKLDRRGQFINIITAIIVTLLTISLTKMFELL